MRIWPGTLAVAIALFGCGGGGEDEDSGNLVRYERDAGRLDIAVKGRKRSQVPFPNQLLVIRSDGHATYKFGPQLEVAFRPSDEELSNLRALLDRIGWAEAAELSGENTDSLLPAASVTHDGTTVKLGDEFHDPGFSAEPAVADRMSELVTELERLGYRAPGAEAAMNKYLRGVTVND